MAAKVNFPSYTSWSFQEYSADDQSHEEQVEDRGSISFGRYTVDSLSWENKSVFPNNRFQDELDKLTSPGSVAKKKAYFEQYYKKVRLLKGLDQEETNQQPQSQTSIQTEISNETDFEHSNDIQTSIQESGSDLDNSEIEESSVCQSEVEEENDMREIESTNIIQELVPPLPVVPPPPAVPPVCLVWKKSMDKFDHEKKLAHEETNQQPQSQIESSNEIQTSIRENGFDMENSEIGASSVCQSEVEEENDMREIESTNIIQELVPPPPAVPPVCLVWKKSMDKFDHEKKLAHEETNQQPQSQIESSNEIQTSIRENGFDMENSEIGASSVCQSEVEEENDMREIESTNIIQELVPPLPVVPPPLAVPPVCLVWKKSMDKFDHEKKLAHEETNQQPQSQIESSNEIQTSIRENGFDMENSEIGASSVCQSEVEEVKEMRQIKSNNIIQETVPPVPVVSPSPVVPPVRLVRSKSMEKLEHAFDSLSKDWVKLKTGMASIRRNKSVESENSQNFEKLKHGMTSIKLSFSTVKELKTNSQKKKASNLDEGKISPKPIKESKPSLQQSPKLVPRTTRISTTGTKSRPDTASSCNKPKSSIGAKNIRKDEPTILGKPVFSSSNGNNKKSQRSSWENFMRPTAASIARANISEVKRSVGINKAVVCPRYKSPLKKEASKPVPPKYRSFGLLSCKKPSEEALRASEKNKQKRKVVNTIGTRRVVPIKSGDSSTRSIKIVSVPSFDNKKTQRLERPAWR